MSKGRQPSICVRPALFRRPGDITDAEEIIQFAQRAEALTFDGVFVGDRLLAEAPADGKIVYGGSFIEATTIMAAIAARTERINIGILVYVVPYRTPLQTAKVFASLDVISRGRIIMGAGLGWNRKEFESLGLDMAGRGAQFEEAIPLIRRLWTGEAVSFVGNWSRLEEVVISPACPRAAGPPIWMASFAPSHSLDFSGGFSAAIRGALDRVGRLADGWAPLTYSASAKRRLSPSDLAAAWDIVGQGATRVGRSPDDITLVHSDWIYILDGPGAKDRAYNALSTFFTGTWEDAKRTYLIGTADEVLEMLSAQSAELDRPVDSYVLTPLSPEMSQLELIGEFLIPALRS
ncbi:MAG TPA: LLM class flavin-dependent oxidoreductase [Alphaproteobacteria bacterium]|nr:LLM class flavin-dependent oxidoreductase [Alphaproteobacteria bacterium]